MAPPRTLQFPDFKSYILCLFYNVLENIRVRPDFSLCFFYCAELE